MDNILLYSLISFVMNYRRTFFSISRHIYILKLFISFSGILIIYNIYLHLQNCGCLLALDFVLHGVKHRQAVEESHEQWPERALAPGAAHQGREDLTRETRPRARQRSRESHGCSKGNGQNGHDGVQADQQHMVPQT